MRYSAFIFDLFWVVAKHSSSISATLFSTIKSISRIFWTFQFCILRTSINCLHTSSPMRNIRSSIPIIALVIVKSHTDSPYSRRSHNNRSMIVAVYVVHLQSCSSNLRNLECLQLSTWGLATFVFIGGHSKTLDRSFVIAGAAAPAP